MPPAPSGAPSTPPSVSVRAWLDRVEPYVVHDPQTGQITGIRLGPAAINDERAAYAMCAAAEYLKASVIPERPALQDLEIRQRSRRNLWLMWAREVLADSGAPELADSATFYSFRAGHSELSAEHFAAGLDYACRCLDAAQDVHERALIAEHVTQIIDTLLRVADVERLLPDAEMGRNVRQRNRRAAQAGVEERRKNAAAARERLQRLVASYRRSNPDAPRRQMARDLAPSVSLGVDALLNRLRRLGL